MCTLAEDLYLQKTAQILYAIYILAEATDIVQ